MTDDQKKNMPSTGIESLRADESVEPAVAALLEGWQDLDERQLAERIDAADALRGLPLGTRERILAKILKFQRKHEAGAGAEQRTSERKDHERVLGAGSRVRFKASHEEFAGEKGVVIVRSDERVMVRVNGKSVSFISPDDLEVLSNGFQNGQEVRFRQDLGKPAYGGDKERLADRTGTIKHVLGWDGDRQCVKVDVVYDFGIQEASTDELAPAGPERRERTARPGIGSPVYLREERRSGMISAVNPDGTFVVEFIKESRTVNQEQFDTASDGWRPGDSVTLKRDLPAAGLVKGETVTIESSYLDPQSHELIVTITAKSTGNRHMVRFDDLERP